MESGRTAALRYAFPRTIPVMVGYLFLGAAYGILMRVNGYGVGWCLAMSALVYAGSLQYVGVELLVSAVNPIYAFFMSLMINARHVFYGLSMLDRYKEAGKRKPYLIFALTDETFSIVCHDRPPAGISRYEAAFWISVLDQAYWVLGTLAGALIGSLISFDTAGLDFALTALFVVIFTDQWKSGRGRLPAVAGVAASLACLLVFGRDAFIIPAMIVILGWITLEYKRGGKSL